MMNRTNATARGLTMAVTAACAAFCAVSAFADRRVTSFNDGWEFSRDGGPFKPVEVPHDWAIAGPFIPDGKGFQGKLPWEGKGAYRKTLVLGSKPEGCVFLDFDGVMAHATVFVNGHPCGRGEYGYLGFRADMSSYLMAGTNTVEVRCDTQGFFTRWYPGGGIYRKVAMVETDDVRIDDSSLRVETSDVMTGEAKMLVRVNAVNAGISEERAELSAVLRDPSGKEAASSSAFVQVGPGERSGEVSLLLRVREPKLWRLQPGAALYSLELSLAAGGCSDRLVRRVGFREFRLDPDRGFVLNGERVQLNGVDLHSDLGPLGMAFSADAMRRQLEVMRDMGANALRTSHNPPAPEVLDLCDEMGIFVWDECFDKWDSTSGRGDVPLEEFVERQLRTLVRRDRVHPSVFVWSIGNEISPGKVTPPGQEGWETGMATGTSAKRSARFRAVVREEDATRPVGMGSCFPDSGKRGDHAPLDVVGWNYRELYVGSHAQWPKQAVLYTESASALSEFGFYADRVPTNKTDYATAVERVDSLDRNAAAWSDIPDREFFRMERDLYCGGEFVWTGIDYLGEPTPYYKAKDASRSSYFGICDLLAFPKDRYWLYRSHWNPSAFTLHVSPSHWNFASGRKAPVYVYTNAKEGELFLNGRSLGRRRKDPSAGSLDDYYSVLPRYRLVWDDVAWEPGELKAVAYGEDGKVVGEKAVRTAGAPVRVVLSPERRYGSLCVVKVTLADKDGNFVPNDDRRIAFAAEGGEIIAVGNSDPHGMDSFKEVGSHPLKFGRAGVYVRVKDGQKATLTATAEGLEPGKATF